jgi:hypothetical protein
MEVKYDLDTQAREVANEIASRWSVHWRPEQRRPSPPGSAHSWHATLRRRYQLSAREGRGRFRADQAAAGTRRKSRRRDEYGHRTGRPGWGADRPGRRRVKLDGLLCCRSVDRKLRVI